MAYYTPWHPTQAAKVSHLWRSLQPFRGGTFAFLCNLSTFIACVWRLSSALLASLDSLILIIKWCIPFSLLWDLYLLLHQLCSFGNILLVIYFHIPFFLHGGSLHSVTPNPSGHGLTLMEESSTIARWDVYLAFICYLYVKLVNKVFQLALWPL